jgi:hypothetical protein
MRTEYRRRFPRTLGQLVFQCAASAIVLQPLLIWRFMTERVVVSIALGGLTLVAFALAYRGLRYLIAQERQHPQPTADMRFVFMLVTIHPLAISVFLLVLLAEM